MIRSPMPQRTQPMAKGNGLRRSRPKMTAARKAAKGQDCTLMFPGCPNDRDTVVLCHLRMFGGGGMGAKPDDTEAVFGDHYCHDRLDLRVRIEGFDMAEWYEHIARALIRTLRIQRESGVLIFKGETD